MDTKLLNDFESAIDSVADVYFAAGFAAGFAVCILVFAIFVALDR